MDELESMGMDEIENAIKVSGFPKQVVDWVWEKKREAFEVY